MGRTVLVDVGEGRTWQIDVRHRDRTEGQPTSRIQIIIPIEELEGASSEEVGHALLGLIPKAREAYVQHWADVYAAYHTSHRTMNEMERALVIELLDEAEAWGIENEATGRLRERLRRASMTWVEVYREFAENQLQDPHIQRLIERVAERQGRFCLLCQTTEGLTADMRPSKEWPKKKSSRKRKGKSAEEDDEEDPDYYQLICLDCYTTRLGSEE
jgi:hypothetical protein